MLLLLAESPLPDDRETLVLVEFPLRTTVLVVVRITRFRLPPTVVESPSVDISCFDSPIALYLGRCASVSTDDLISNLARTVFQFGRVQNKNVKM